MYLYRKQHVRPGTKVNQDAAGEAEPTTFVVEGEAILKEEIGYWRKANQIHHWFVENVQGGEDNCEEYKVTREQLGGLLDIVQEVIKSIKLVPGAVSVGQRLVDGEWIDQTRPGFVIADPTIAKALLPVREGFFFGSYDYDSWYFDNLVVTKDILETALASYPDAWFTYQSSW